MGMFFNSWKDDDAEYYYGTISDTGSSNYNRGYDDGYEAGQKSICNSRKSYDRPKDYRTGYNEGYEDAKKEFKKSFDSAYNKGFRAGLDLYMERKEPLKKDALELLMDELELNEALRSIEPETIDVQDDSEPEICSEPDYDKPENVQYDECEVDSEPDDIISIEPQRDSLL